MSNKVYTLLLVILGGFTAVILVIWGVFSLRDNLSTNTLQDAVRLSMYNSRDDSARTERGLFIVNKAKFEKSLTQYRIKEFNGKELSNDEFKVEYLPDSQTKVKTNGNYEAIKAVRVSANLNTGDIKGKKANADEHVATFVVQTYGKNKDKDKSPDVTRDNHDELTD